MATLNEESSFSEVGDVINNSVSIRQGFNKVLPVSECVDTCSECAKVDSMSFLFSPGDHILLGLYSIHWNGQSFACGNFRENSPSYMAMTAFLGSVKWLRQQYPQHNFGYLVVDDCYDPLVANSMLVKVLSGDLKITDNATGVVFDPKNVVVGVGAQSSPATMASVIVLQRLNISLISYSATNPNLDNHITYPYFSRTVSSDRIQAKVLGGILEALKVTHVGAICIKNTYGLELYKIFREIAEEKGICVEDALEMTKDTTTLAVKEVLTSYRLRRIRVVITIAMDALVAKVLSAAIQDDTFVFVGSEAWGPNDELIGSVNGERARGSLVLSTPVIPVDYGLREYMYSLNPFDDATSDAWLREYWQDQFNCDFPGGFYNTETKSCDQKKDLFNNSFLDPKLQAPLTVHSIYSTISAGLAVDKMASAGKSVPYDPKEMTESIRQVQLRNTGGQAFKPFLFSGNGNGGFQIFNVQQEQGGYQYVKVGEASGEGVVDLDRSSLKFYDITGNVVSEIQSSCLYRPECTAVCKESPTEETSTSTPPPTAEPVVDKNKEESDSPVVIVLAIICGLLLVVLLVIIVLGLLCYKGVLSLNSKDGSSDRGMVVPHYAPASHSSSGARSQYTGSMDCNPPLPPARRRPSQANEGIVNSGFSDLDDNRSDTPSSIPLSVSNEPLNRVDINPATLPPPKPHATVSPCQINPQKSGSSSGGSLDPSRRSPTPSQTTQPRFFITTGAEQGPFYPDETLAKFPQAESCPKLPSPSDGVEAAPTLHNSVSLPAVSGKPVTQVLDPTYIDRSVYNPGDFANNSPLNNPYAGGGYWFVKNPDGSIVPYENFLPVGPLANAQSIPYTAANPKEILPGSHHVLIEGNPYPLAVHPQTVHANSNVPGSSSVLHQPQDNDPGADNFSNSVLSSADSGYQPESTTAQSTQPALRESMSTGPNPHNRQSKYQDDYITAVDAPGMEETLQNVITENDHASGNALPLATDSGKVQTLAQHDHDSRDNQNNQPTASSKDRIPSQRPQELPVVPIQLPQNQDTQKVTPSVGLTNSDSPDQLAIAANVRRDGQGRPSSNSPLTTHTSSPDDPAVSKKDQNGHRVFTNGQLPGTTTSPGNHQQSFPNANQHGTKNIASNQPPKGEPTTTSPIGLDEIQLKTNNTNLNTNGPSNPQTSKQVVQRRPNNRANVQPRISDIPEVDQESDSLV